jgi:viroplasmin and RNaseH domain-containing protein
MKAASISEIKQELNNIPSAQLLELCLRLAKYKKDNKELLNYLLFEGHDEQAYIQNVKDEIEQEFTEINTSNLYFAKKSLRKILRNTAKHIRYTASKQAEVELLIHFCQTLKDSVIPIKNGTVIYNLYHFQIKKVAKTIATLHEDLQYDYLKQLKKLQQ